MPRADSRRHAAHEASAARTSGLISRNLRAPVHLRSPATRTSGVTTFLRLSAQPLGLPCGSPWRRAHDASNRHLLPITFTTSTRASGVPACSTNSACAMLDGDHGECGVSRRHGSLRLAPSVPRGALSSPTKRRDPNLLTPLSRTRTRPRGVFRLRVSSSMPRPHCSSSRERTKNFRGPRCLPSLGGVPLKPLRTLFPTSEGAEPTFCRSHDFAIAARRSAFLSPAAGYRGSPFVELRLSAAR